MNDSLHFHSIRHTVVTNLIKNDVSINKVKEFIGHKSISTTLKYTHLNVEDYRSVADMVKVI
jgi:site-specific recombinase XerD